MDLLKSVPHETVIQLYYAFHFIELAVHVLGFMTAAIFLTKFCRLHSVHINLRWIFASFIIAACITCIWRVYYCLLQLAILTVNDIVNAVAFAVEMRNAAIYATGLHMILVALERLYATVRSETYENEHNIKYVIVSIAFLWGFSYGVVYFLEGVIASDFVAALLFSAIYASAIVLMLRVRKANVNKWKDHRGTLQFSHSYQVRENVTSATCLYKCFVVYSIQVIVSWFCVLLHLVFRDIYKVPILEITFGFIFNLMVALVPITLPLSTVIYSEKVRKQFQSFLRKVGVRSENAQSFVDFEGKQTKIKAGEETAAYFNQFRAAWS